MIETDKKGCKKLLTQRILLAVVSSITLHFFLAYCLVLFTNLNVDYVHWLQNTWTTVTSLRMWIYLILLAAVTSLQGVFCSKIYLYKLPYYKSRFAKLCATLTVRNLSLKASYIAMGGTLVWLHLSLKGGTYSSLTADCSIIYGTCLVEEYYFLLFSGLWSGLYFSVKANDSMKHFQFSIIAQSKFHRLKQGIYTLLPKLMISSTWSTLYYMAVYYFLGSYCRGALLSMISLQTEVEPLDNMSRLLNLTLILHLWLHQFIFILTISSTYLLFEIYLTEWTPFKFGSSGAYSGDTSELTLIDVLSMDKIPIMQYLGYLDLVTIAQKEKIRRGILFTLSQPGGHPYNWNCIVQRCLDLLKNFSSNLNAISMKPQEQPFCYSTKVLTARIVPAQPAQKDIYRMRKLVPDMPPVPPIDAATKEVPYSGTFIQKFITQKREAFIAYLLSKPVINYIFGEQDDNKIRYVLLDGQLVIWAAETISSLAVFSLSEDSYGVVQKDVPNIINTLLSVKQVLDKLQKSAVLARKIQADDKLTKEIFISLRSAIKRSLYRIATHFEPYINDLSLESLTIEQLQGFLSYRE